MTDSLEAAIDRLFEKLIFCNPERPQFGDKEACIPLVEFGELDAFSFWPKDIIEDWICLNPDTSPVTPDVLWPIDVSAVVDKGSHISLQRASTTSAKELRGKVSIVPRYTLKLLNGSLADNKYYTEIRYVGLIGGKWTAIDDVVRPIGYSGAGMAVCRIGKSKSLSNEIASTVQASMQLALNRRYDWTVSIRIDDSPTILFTTDPTGVKEVFRLRDIPDGGRKRSALKHWVREHWRKRRKDPSDFTTVRKHLRGAERFSWNGFDCVVRPSPFDIERSAPASGIS